MQTEPEPQLLFNGRLVLTSAPKKPKRRIEDISTWLEAFSSYCLVLVSYFPNRWKDLLQYQLLILCTYRQFAGRVWWSHDTLASYGWPKRAPRCCFIADHMQIMEPGSLCGPFCFLPRYSQVCQLPWPAPLWSLLGQNAQQTKLVVQAFSRLSALSVQQQVSLCVDSPTPLVLFLLFDYFSLTLYFVS